MSVLTNLPVELQTHILQYLTTEDHIFATQVCSLWKYILTQPFILRDRYMTRPNLIPRGIYDRGLTGTHKILHLEGARLQCYITSYLRRVAIQGYNIVHPLPSDTLWLNTYSPKSNATRGRKQSDHTIFQWTNSKYVDIFQSPLLDEPLFHKGVNDSMDTSLYIKVYMGVRDQSEGGHFSGWGFLWNGGVEVTIRGFIEAFTAGLARKLGTGLREEVYSIEFAWEDQMLMGWGLTAKIYPVAGQDYC